MKSTLMEKKIAPDLHVAIIMDGNGRWASARGLPRPAGHRKGQGSVREVVRAAPGLGIRTLTLFAFSSDNWKRPSEEVDSLMGLLERYLRSEAAECCREGVRVNVIGRRDRLMNSLLLAVREAEFRTTFCRKLHLRIAVDYSAQDAIRQAGSHASAEEFFSHLNQVVHSDPPAPPVDLLIRTGGEQRLSDFLLWECAYAELVFSNVLWPDFRIQDLADAVQAYSRRNRRFGGLSEAIRPENVREAG